MKAVQHDRNKLEHLPYLHSFVKYCSYHSKIKFISLRRRVISSIYFLEGYATHMIGKWHLGYNKWEYTPTYRGFDTFYGYYNAQEDHYSHKILDILDFRDNKEPVRDLDRTYATFPFAEVMFIDFV